MEVNELIIDYTIQKQATPQEFYLLMEVNN